MILKNWQTSICYIIFVDDLSENVHFGRVHFMAEWWWLWGGFSEQNLTFSILTKKTIWQCKRHNKHAASFNGWIKKGAAHSATAIIPKLCKI